jgi:hypothetical protein
VCYSDLATQALKVQLVRKDRREILDHKVL